MQKKDKPVRLIARLDVKGENLIKGVHLEGLRVLGDPQEFTNRYYEQGADELIYMDIVASLYGRSNLIEIVQKAASNVFIPLTVGGGVRSIEDVTKLLCAGADKVAVNTAAVHRPNLIYEISRKFGSQCMVLSIEAKRISGDTWEVYTDCGREPSGISVVDWVRRGIDLGAGEILLTSIDSEGARKGFDVKLFEHVDSISSVPVILSGGYGAPNHLLDALDSGACAIAFADALHYDRVTFSELKEIAKAANVNVR